MSFPTWKTNTGNSFIFPNSILDGQVDISGTFYNRLGNVIIGDSANPDFDPSSNGITLNTTRICLGKDSSVTGDNGVAIGNSATTGLQENSISIGYNSIVDASNSIAIGPDASANGLNSIALGYNSGTGSYTNSIALGANSTVGANNVICLGDGTQKVGIGTTTPNEVLEISGNVFVNSPDDLVGLSISAGQSSSNGSQSSYLELIRYDDNSERNNWKLLNDGSTAGNFHLQRKQGANGTYTSYMTVKGDNGNVGIGTTTPTEALSVNGNIGLVGSGNKYIRGASANLNLESEYELIIKSDWNDNNSNLPADIIFYTASAERMRIKRSKNNTSNTSGSGGVEFSGGINVKGTWDTFNYGNSESDWLGNTGVGADPPEFSFSAHFEHAIESYAIVVTSDVRIKDNINNINDDIALQQLRLLSPKTYKYKDTIKRGSQEVIGFIAQEVREVLPRAVALGTNYIPSIMKLATAFNKEGNTIEIRLDTSLDDITTLTTGSKIKIIIQSKSIDTSILSFSNDIFEIPKTEEFTVTDGENVFVYGEIVDDFHFLDKNAIFTIATAALQEVDRQQQTDKLKIATLESKVATLETQITDLLARVTALENP